MSNAGEVAAKADRATSRGPIYALAGGLVALVAAIGIYTVVATGNTRGDVTNLTTTVREVPCEGGPPGDTARARQLRVARARRCQRVLRSYAMACVRYPQLCVLLRRGTGASGDVVLVPPFGAGPPTPSTSRGGGGTGRGRPPNPGGQRAPSGGGGTTTGATGPPGPQGPQGAAGPPTPAPSPTPVRDAAQQVERQLGQATGGLTCRLGVPCP